MKRTDIALIILIVSFSGAIAYWVASSTLGEANKKPIEVRTVEAISVDATEVDREVFSDNAINPTVKVTIEGESLTDFENESLNPPTETPDANTDVVDPSTDAPAIGNEEDVLNQTPDSVDGQVEGQ